MPDNDPVPMVAGKSFKREIGGVGVAAWALISLRVFFLLDDPEMVAALAGVYSAMTWAVWGYVGAAFCQHSFQQWKDRPGGASQKGKQT